MAKLTQLLWPGPLTLIFKARPDLPSWAKAADGTVSLRVPAHEGLLVLLNHFPGLFSTSANVSGQPLPMRVEDIDPHILEKAEVLVVEEMPGETKLPSTILDCSGPRIKIVREGAYSRQLLEKATGYCFDK
jgi:tRNA A37 threonylcarbamoyladenosine synthetase subunit TsaC/SUA5/YrdC